MMWMYGFLVLLLTAVLGIMGWLTVKSGKVNKQVMNQAKQETPQLVAHSKQMLAQAEARRDVCQELSTSLPS